ncbi:MAG: hypothetical protein EB065_11740, partial [Betaproteobacteria bacterium]|nr:hypothetical protein [Betaproteobacteria bacterium]
MLRACCDFCSDSAVFGSSSWARRRSVEHLPLYVDGADEVDPQCRLIKGGGGALTREKILADLAERFVCIVDEAKCVPVLGGFPLPIEVLALARAQVTRKLEALGA